jgi:hypothetical protein
MTISELEELFLKETGLVAPDKETTSTGGQPPRAARKETWHLWLKKIYSGGELIDSKAYR